MPAGESSVYMGSRNTSSYMDNTPLPQAYTATIVGQDGTIYTTNNSEFYAVRK